MRNRIAWPVCFCIRRRRTSKKLQDVLGQYSRSALSLDDDFLLAWGNSPAMGGNLERLVAGFAESE
ncbi:hypothetical protein, partial [Salmonella enterica]|uniref:hypothetical protein n=1 Tax=Salmonella enterica TaxID=28901 RepID=UPI001C31C236